MRELVLAINRDELVKQGITSNGIFPLDLQVVDQLNYAMLPRAWADNKSASALSIGVQFPQILGYFQLMYQGKIFVYQRKGKEEGLLGKWSIGVGGHISQEDLYDAAYNSEDGITYPDIIELIQDGSERELREELGTNIFISRDQFTRVIHTTADPTSSVHVGLPVTLELTERGFKDLKLDPAEFNNINWIEPHLLKVAGLELETWSQMLVDEM